jgi:hypothetical protein
MARWLYLLGTFAALAAWAGAQNSAPPLGAEDKLRLLKSNGALIDNLVNDGVAISNADAPVRRVESCRGASLSLVNAIRHAADADDAERVAELTGLFRDFVREGLAPTLKEAQRDVPPESPDGKRLRELGDIAARDLTDLRAAIGKSEKLNQNPRVKDAAKGLDELGEAFRER